MKNFLKFLSVLFFFSIIPSFIIWKSALFYLNSIEENKECELSDYISTTLRELKRDINLEKGKEKIFSEYITKIGNFCKIDDDIAKIITDYFNQKYPGMVNIIVLKAKKKDGEIFSAKPLHYGKLKNKFIFKILGQYLFQGLIKNKDYSKIIHLSEKMKRKISKGKIKLINKKIFGGVNSIEKVFVRRGYVNEAKFDGKRVSFLWEPFSLHIAEHSPKTSFSGIAILIIYNDIYKSFFSTKRIVDNKKKILEKKHINLKLINLDTTSISLVSSDEQRVIKSINKNINFLKKVEDKENIYFFLPLRETDKFTLFSSFKKENIYPEKRKYKLIISVIIWIYILLFGIVAALIYSGSLNLFISVRTQLVSLFLMASFLPLTAVFILGFKYLDLSKVMFINKKYEMIKKKISTIEEKKRDIFENIRNYLVKIKYGVATDCINRFIEGLKKDYNETLESKKFEDIKYLRKYKDKIFAPLHKKMIKLRKEGLIDNYYIFDAYGHMVILTKNREFQKTIFLERDALSGIAQKIIQYTNNGTIDSKMPTSTNKLGVSGLLDNLLEGSGGDGKSALIKRRNLIHQIKIFNLRITLFFEPLLDKEKKAVAVLGVAINYRNIADDQVEKFVLDNSSKEIKLYAASITDLSKRFPTLKKFNSQKDILSLFEKVKREKNPTRKIIKSNGKKYIAWAGFFGELNDYVIIGIYPYEKVENFYQNNLEILIGVFIISILIVIFIGIIISKKFIRPVKSLEEGVKAITEGELNFRMNIKSNDELGALSKIFNKMVTGLQEKERMSRYVSESVLSEVKKGEIKSEKLGEEKKVTILFSDIRNFTTISEENPPEVIVKLLNDYLNIMTSIIVRNGGIIDKFIGDAIMAVFYPEKDMDSDEKRAVIAALQMRDALQKFNNRRRKKELFEIDNGIGINSGKVIKGNIGSTEYRIDLTIIGDNVNIAARLESLSKEGKFSKIIISSTTYEKVKGIVEVVKIGKKQVKGKSHSVEVYEITGLSSLDKYIPLLNSSDISKVLEGINFIGIIGNENSIKLLIDKLGDDNPIIRKEICYILNDQPEIPQKFHDKLFEITYDEEDDVIKSSLINLIGEKCNDETILKLETLLSDKNTRVRANIIESIGKIEDKNKTITTLRKYLKDPNNRIRGNASVMLWKLGEIEAHSTLLEMTLSNDEFMRASGAWGLGEIGSMENIALFEKNRRKVSSIMNKEFFEMMDKGLDSLHNLLNDNNLMVLRNSIKALGKTGNRRSTIKLIEKFQKCDNDEIRMLILTVLDEIGSYNIVKKLKNELNL